MSSVGGLGCAAIWAFDLVWATSSHPDVSSDAPRDAVGLGPRARNTVPLTLWDGIFETRCLTLAHFVSSLFPLRRTYSLTFVSYS